MVNAQRAHEDRMRFRSRREAQRRQEREDAKRKRLERSARGRSAPTPYDPAPRVAECWFAAHLDEPRPCAGGLVRCHLIDQALLAREFKHGHDGRALAVLQADARAWVWGCGGDTGLEGHHGQLDFSALDSKRIVIPRALLPEGVEAMAEELGLLWFLDRTYGVAS